MAEGRVEGRVVREYLEALRNSKGKPGRKRTPDSVSRRMEAIEFAVRYDDGVGFVLWTSGTTGRPKPILHTHVAYLELLDRVLDEELPRFAEALERLGQ